MGGVQTCREVCKVQLRSLSPAFVRHIWLPVRVDWDTLDECKDTSENIENCSQDDDRPYYPLLPFILWAHDPKDETPNGGFSSSERQYISGSKIEVNLASV